MIGLSGGKLTDKFAFAAADLYINRASEGSVLPPALHGSRISDQNILVLRVFCFKVLDPSLSHLNSLQVSDHGNNNGIYLDAIMTARKSTIRTAAAASPLAKWISFILVLPLPPW